MVVMLTTLPVILLRMVCLWAPSMPERNRLQSDVEEWAYSKKAITFETILNIVIAVLSVLLLVWTAAENPNVPVRVWVAVHAVQCLVHVILVRVVYRHVTRRRRGELQDFESHFHSLSKASFAYICDFFNMLVSLVWMSVGFSWAQSGDKLLQQNASCLYWWFTRAYLAYDVNFARIWLAGIIVCWCLPRFILIRRYRVRTVAGQQVGALEADLNVLPKYRFHMSRNLEKPRVDAGVMVPMDINSGDSSAERVVLPEDSECCICLCSYDDGIELHALPCNHHFHATCSEKWLKINAYCPVCKYNILSGSAEV
ncbi:E3 ubiquitin protein ligase RIE1-like isoform X2 [Silene latifolia]|uniref:E3 ubiquitin protein ligase RIE1-like isoform X2 n=1 Tax=Silene latifolia TaxID=37657 RepID=UPI003D7775CC